MTDAPEIGGRKPVLVTLEKAGGRVFWCACGRSKTQPFCDGSHKGTSFVPKPYVATRDGEEILLCACKRTRTPPFCDGSHNALAETYETASEDEIRASASIPIVPRDDAGRAMLDGGCFVLTPDKARAQAKDGWRILPVINRASGADKLSQFVLEAGANAKPLRAEGDAILFIEAGEGEALIGGKSFAAGPHCAVAVRRGEAFAFRSSAPVAAVATICPSQDDFESLADMPAHFDARFPERAGRLDLEARQTMGDRFYQVLIDEKTGGDQVTQFIGDIPKSRAAAHRHLYEEALYIIAGEGFMWTETRRAAVHAGDIIYLPRKQLHSLEATSEGGMRLAGAFYPAGSPAVNY